MLQRKRNWKLYGLKLENGKYYVGISSKSIEERFREHKYHIRGAAWTWKNPPVQIIYKENLGFITEEEAKIRENSLIREYLKKYGENNARGGDISMSDELVKRFGWHWIKFYWEAQVAVTILAAMVISLIIICFYLLYK